MNEVEQSIKFVPHLANKRFFTVPKFGETFDEVALEGRLIQLEQPENTEKGQDIMRYAAYIRISSEEQVGNFSVDAQRRAIDTWVQSQGGKIVHYYVDEAQSGRTADRPEFLNLRRDAKNKKFDAIIVHKFDRFARNRTESLAIKSLLRHDYGIKVFSVSEPSEDSDGALGALIEGIMESVADWYSRNLAQETVKGKRERAAQGYHNNLPPFGTDKSKDGVLLPNDHELKGLTLAFELYSTGNKSDNDIARELNERGYRTKAGKLFSTEMVRDMLQNRTYLGFVKYQPYQRHADGRRSWAGKVEWFPGKHQALIPQDLFDRCQEIRNAKAIHHEFYPKHRVYLLRDLVYCAECVANMPSDVEDEEYGKMRPHTNQQGIYRYYRCRARDFTRECSQTSTRAEALEQQVVAILKTLKPPTDWRDKMVQAMGQLIGDQNLDERIAQIKSIIERMDFRWDNGFITDKDAYLEERIKLQQELEQLTPIPDDELEVAADVLANFTAHWEATKGDMKAQEELIKLIVARVWVRGDKVVGMSLRPNYHVTVGLDSTKPTEIAVGLSEDIMGGDIIVHRRGRRDLNPRSLP
ncbi:MAG: recombinase RecD [Chloroflexota bacterium]|nr:MAG: recombinase RecD [Chloroflexota bacterium]